MFTCIHVYVLMSSHSEHRVENPSNYIGTQIGQMKQGSKKWIWGERRRALPESVGGNVLFPKSEPIFCTLFGSFSIHIKNLFAANMDSLCLEWSLKKLKKGIIRVIMRGKYC